MAADPCRSQFFLVYITQISPVLVLPVLLILTFHKNTVHIMVHLGQVTNDSERKKEEEASNGIDMSKLGPEGSSPGDFETSIYGSRFATEDLPRHEMPDGEMPAATAYRMIKDDLTLDGNPTLKYTIPPPLYIATANMIPAWPRSSLPTWSPKSNNS